MWLLLRKIVGGEQNVSGAMIQARRVKPPGPLCPPRWVFVLHRPSTYLGTFGVYLR